MARFYGVLQGAKGQATRLGHRSLTTTAATWNGAVKVSLSVDEDGRERYDVELIPWHGQGENRVLAWGYFVHPRQEKEAA